VSRFDILEDTRALGVVYVFRAGGSVLVREFALGVVEVGAAPVGLLSGCF
jgi:hypothetical protein